MTEIFEICFDLDDVDDDSGFFDDFLKEKLAQQKQSGESQTPAKKKFELEFDEDFDDWLAKPKQKSQPEKKFELKFDADFDEWLAKHKQNNQSAQQEQGKQSQPKRKFELKIDDDFDGLLANSTQTAVTTIAETVFISYSSKEQQTVEEIKQKLEAAGIKCWMAPKSIPLGSDYGAEIPKAIKGSKIFLLILSENSQNSKWVPKELDMAIKYDVKVIPFHIDNSAIIDKFEFSLINCQGIEAYKRKNAAFKDLKEAILTELKKTRA